jgi:hypothetical protein
MFSKAFKRREHLSDFLFCDSAISIFIHPAFYITWYKFQLEINIRWRTFSLK